MLALCLLTGCTAAPAETVAPTQTVEVTVSPDPYAWTQDYIGENDHATIEGFYHRPFEELPRELRDSLTYAGDIETEQGYSFWLRTYTAPGIEIVTTEAPPEVLVEYLETMLEQWEENKEDWKERWPTQEDLKGEVEGEKGREWLYSVTVTDDSYATLYGLRVGLTVEEGIALGYPLEQRQSFGAGSGNQLKVTVEDGKITRMHTFFGMGRYVGRYWDI